MTSPAGGNVEDRLAVRAAKAANRLFTRVYHQTRILSPAGLPRSGPGILVCNHVSSLDPMIVQSAASRMIVWMMAREYYDIPAMKWFFEIIHAIPVERSGRDLAATRAALRALSDGRILGIFPEGRIETEHRLLPFQTGVALLALRAGVDLFPAYLDGTQRGREMAEAVLVPNEITLRFGRRLTLPEKDTSRANLETATNRIQQAVESLRLTGRNHSRGK